MLRKLRALLGLCPHKWEHMTNVMTTKGPRQVLQCRNCYSLRWRKWSRRDDQEIGS